MEEMLVLVDKNDKEVGLETRERCHAGKGKLHRALVVFLFNKQRALLVQQRSLQKQLWPGYWDCTVATHVYPNETYEKAAERALKRELGISTHVKPLFAFTYFASFGDYTENEYCTLLVGNYDGEISANQQEIAAFKHVSLLELKERMTKEPENYTPWFKLALQKFLSHPSSKSFSAAAGI